MLTKIVREARVFSGINSKYLCSACFTSLSRRRVDWSSISMETEESLSCVKITRCSARARCTCTASGAYSDMQGGFPSVDRFERNRVPSLKAITALQKLFHGGPRIVSRPSLCSCLLNDTEERRHSYTRMIAITCASRRRYVNLASV